MANRISFSESELEHKSALELRDLVSRYRRMFNGSGYGFWEWDLTTHQIDWSGGFWATLGYGEADHARISDAHQLPDFIHQDDREIMLEAVREHLRTGIPLNTSYRIRTHDNHYIWTQVRADSIRDRHGRALYISGVNFDITELKNVEAALRESEARQARIIQASNDGIWEWYAGRAGFHFSNRCWEHIGYHEKDDVVNQGQNRLQVWRSHIHPEDLPKFDLTLAEHMEGKGQGQFDIEYRIYSKQGDLRWVRARGRASFDNRGRPIRMSGTNMDITDIKRAEERVMQAKEAAERANRAKSEFLSSMSHELRTPLNAILGYAQLFEYDGNLTEQQTGNLREIRQAGEHLLQLINDVLDLAKIESGKMTVSLEPVLLSRVIAECFTLVQTQADSKGIKLYASFGQQADSYVIADHVRLKQALINLLSNAVKYNRVGGEVEVRLSIQSGDVLRITVRDTGQGIAENRQQEVFQPFNRLNAETTKVEGSGVGLVITKQLVEMMNGTLDFSSAEGVGTEFWVDLPLCSDWSSSQPALVRPANEQPAPVLRISKRKKVLYVEDNPSNIRLLQQLFVRYPVLQLDVAEEAFLGIYKARSELPDLVIMDINLPGMDGYEALSVLKRDAATAHIPVVGLSANAMPYDIERGKSSGFYDYLTKPLQIHQLLQVLNELLGDEAPQPVDSA